MGHFTSVNGTVKTNVMVGVYKSGKTVRNIMGIGKMIRLAV